MLTSFSPRWPGLAGPHLTPLLLVILFGTLIATVPASAQGQYTLLHSLIDPSTNAQSGAEQGYSVALDGNIAVTGAPFDDVGGDNSGVVKVYNATTGALLHTLTNPSPAGDDRFGYSVAISGMRVVVGAYLDDTGAANAGSAYVYDLAGPTPTLPVATFNNPSPADSDYFGYSVAVSGTRVVVGAYLDDTGATDAGSAYVYDLASATPTVPVAVLNNPSPAVGDAFGWSVAVSGTRVVVGAFRDDAGAPDAGSAYAYDLASPTPTLPVATLNNPSPTMLEGFGNSVAVSGSWVVVGAPFQDFDAGDAGAAYVYDLASATPAVPVNTLRNPSPAGADLFGSSVAVSGRRVVVGVYQDDTGAPNAGSAYVYELDGPTPTVPVVTVNNPSPADSDYFGYSVAVSGTRVVVGAYLDDTVADAAGSAYVYDLAGATPTMPVAVLNNPSPAARHSFGWSVAVSGRRVVAGAPAAGGAYVYDLASATPTVPVATFSGGGLSVSASGTRVIIGAPFEGTPDAGRAYVYDLASATPTVPVTTLNNPSPSDPFSVDFFGFSVAVSGTCAVIGAYQDHTGGSRVGIAYVYELASITPTVPAATLTNPTPAFNDGFGYSVAVSGTRVVVGDPFNAGSAYVYDLASATPTVPVAMLTNAGSDSFGSSVAVSGARVVVAAPSDDTGAPNAGSAYVYDLASVTPTVPVAVLNNPSPAANDGFGSSVSVSGTRVVVGAYLDDTVADAAGSAYVYDLATATPTVPVAVLNNPSPTVHDTFGRSVAVDGTSVVAGAPWADGGTVDRGAAYVFGIVPALRIVPAAPGFATLSWTPADSPGFLLQYSDSLAPANWLDAPTGAANPVTVPATNERRFYRLFSP